MQLIDKVVYQSERRAKALLDIVPKGDLFVGMTGLQMEPQDCEIRGSHIRIRRVSNPPGIVHVCCAADSYSDVYGAARFSSAIKAEIVIERGTEQQEDETPLLESAYHTAALIKLAGQLNLTCPVSATSSWNTIAAITDHSVHFRMLDDVPRRLGIQKPTRSLSKEDIEWVTVYWESALRLRHVSRRFGLAFNLAYVWNHTNDIRVGIANLWCGLEALFGRQSDKKVTQSLVKRIVKWVPSFSKDSVGSLYDERCNAVHGRMSISQNAVRDSAELLRQSIIRCIESSSVPLPDWELDAR
jgi:hypothetical protein